MSEGEKVRVSGDIAGFHKLVLEGMKEWLAYESKDGEEYKKKITELQVAIIQRGLDDLYHQASKDLDGKDFLTEVQNGFPIMKKKRQAGKNLLTTKLDKVPKNLKPGTFLLSALDIKDK